MPGRGSAANSRRIANELLDRRLGRRWIKLLVRIARQFRTAFHILAWRANNPMAKQQHPERSIFLAAIELGSAAARAVFLDQACADNPKLRADVEALLLAHEH